MSRSKHKSWQNGPEGGWSARITWYQGESPEDVRLELIDCERAMNVFPQSREEADHVWFAFKQGAPPDGQQTPFVADLLDLLSRRYPHLTRPTEE